MIVSMKKSCKKLNILVGEVRKI